MDYIVLHVCKVFAITSISHDYVKLGIVAAFRSVVMFSNADSKWQGWCIYFMAPLCILFLKALS